MGKKEKKKEVKPPARHLSSLKLLRFAFLLFLFLAVIYLFEYLSPNRMLAGSDWLMGSFPSWRFMAEFIKKYGNIAFWHPHIFGGVPTVAAFFGDLFSPATLFRLFISPHLVFVYVFVVFIFLAGFGTYLYLKELNLGYLESILGGILYMFAGSLVTTTYAGHAGRLGSAAAFPWILLLLHRGLKEKKVFYFILMGALFAFCFLACHFQLIYYGILASGFYFLIHLIAERKENGAKGTLKLIIFYLIGIFIMGLLIAIQYLPVYSNLPLAARGQEKGFAFATSWALPPLEIFDLLVPNFSGILDSYWGENYFKLHSEYLGVLPILVSGIALLFLFGNRYVKYFVFLGLIALLFSLGAKTPVFRLFYYLPGVSKFRAPSQAFYLVAFSLVTLTGFGLKEVLQIGGDKEKLRRLQKYLIYFLIIISLLFLLTLLFKENILNALKGYIERGSHPGEDKIRNLFNNYPSFQGRFLLNISLLIIYSLLLFLLGKKKRGSLLTFGIIFGILAIFDSWSIGKRFMKSTVPPEEYYAPDEVVNFLSQDKGFYRVYPLHYERSNDGILMYYDIHSVGGYHPNPLQSYQEFIGAEQTVMFQPTNLFHKNFLDLLNVKYIITIPLPEDLSRYDPNTQNLIKTLKDFFSSPDFSLVFQGRRYLIYENKTFLPRAFLVGDYEVLRNKDEVLNRLKGDFNPREKVLLSETVPSFQSEKAFFAPAEILEYNPNQIKISAKSDRPCFLVLLENYHPDWQAKVDGKKVKVYRADHTFRAIPLPEGEHEVIFFYDSKYYRLGSLLSLLGLALVFISLFFWWKGKRF
ncbi:MAG: YfhO family protein [candidate division WOR-3 bacterium]